jgi:heme/copper-type cytochrome/quinol oxidase subunit 2
MGPMTIRARFARTERRLLALLAVLVLAGSVVVHHGEPHAMGPMGHGDDHQMAGATMCAGTIVAAIAIVGLVATVVRLRRRPTPHPPAVLLSVVVRLVPTAPLARARAGPLYLQHAVLRR